ncbi:MAG: hypothetical protein WBL40_01135, partial [Terrimicrobiaceae bacterium]
LGAVVEAVVPTACFIQALGTRASATKSFCFSLLHLQSIPSSTDSQKLRFHAEFAIFEGGS